jgi:uncharacterized membrane protein YkoI
LPLAVFLASTLPIAPAAFAAEGKEKVVKLEDIPAPARATILKEAKGAPILKVETEDRKGQTLYEAHVKRGKDEIGILVDAKGKLIGTHSEKDEKNEK